MRITTNIMITNFLRNLNSISERIQRSQEQLTTGLKYSRPGHGPVEVGQAIGFKASLARIDQYVKNVDDGSSHASYLDTILQSIISDTGRARDLATDAANDSMSSADRQASAQEIELLIGSTIQNGNSRFRDRFIFGGWQSKTLPFEKILNERTGFVEDILYKGDRGHVGRLVGDADRMNVSVSGKDLFLQQTYTVKGKSLPTDKALGFHGDLKLNGVSVQINPADTLRDIQKRLEGKSSDTHVFASLESGRLKLESAYAIKGFELSDNRNGLLLEDFGIILSGAFNIGTVAPALPIVDSTPAMFTAAGPVTNLTYDNTNNTLNIFLGADANKGVSKAANIFITPGTYASVADLIVELQTQIDNAFGKNRIIVSDTGGGALQLTTVATGDEIGAGDLVIGGPFNGLEDTASDSADLNLIAVVGNAPPTNAGTIGTDGNDKIIIDLGPSALDSGKDLMPQVIDIRAGSVTNATELMDEIKYQIMQNDVLRGRVNVRLQGGRLHFETARKGENVLAADFKISEGATGTLAALGISGIPTPARFTGSPLIFPFIVIAGFNDTVTIDLGPSLSKDGTNPPPVTIRINPGVYGNINAIYNQINSKFLANSELGRVIQVAVGGPPGGEYLSLETVAKGSQVRGEDLIISGALAGTLGWGSGSATPGGGSANGRGLELESANMFKTLISMRDDMMGTVSKNSRLNEAVNDSGDLLDIINGDIVRIKYDMNNFIFTLNASDTIQTLADYIQDALGTRADVSVTTDGRINIRNNETFYITNLKVTIESATGVPRTKANAILSELSNAVSGLNSTVTGKFFDPTRYQRLGNEDLALSDNDLENTLQYEAIIGARANRLAAIMNLYSTETLNISSLKASVDAINYAEVATLLSQQDIVLQSALTVGAKILPRSLFDFLV